ncbi:MAG: FlgD immunoglobulin-like domain containing protein [Candidatus Eisenbacteria bacterium]
MQAAQFPVGSMSSAAGVAATVPAILVAILAAVFAAAAPPASADCTEYEDYLGWAGGMGLPGYGRGVAVDRNTAYVTMVGYDSWRGALFVVDVTDPRNMEVLGRVGTPGAAEGSAEAVAISGHYAVVADGGSGLQIVDVSDPTSPWLVGGVATSYAYDVAVRGHYAFTVGHQGGLSVVDFSDPAHPQLVHNLALWPYTAKKLALCDDYAYVVANGWGLLIVDISNPQAPFLAGSLETGDAWSVAVKGRYAYVGSARTVRVVDVSDPAHAQVVGELASIPFYANDVEIDGTKLYVAYGASGFRVVDVSDPTDPTLEGSLTSMHGLAVALSGERAYILQPDRFDAIDITHTSSIDVLGRIVSHGWNEGMAVSGRFAYLANGEDGLEIVDLSDPRFPATVAIANTPGVAWSVAYSANYAYVADGETGLQVIDVSEPSHPIFSGSLDAADARAVAVSGNRAYLAEAAGGLKVVDIHDPRAPALEGSVWWPDGATAGLALSGRCACVATQIGSWPNGNTRVIVIDVSTVPPRIVGEVDVPGEPTGIAARGSYAFVTTLDAGLLAIDFSSPESPEIADNVAISYANDVAVDGPVVYVADHASMYWSRQDDVIVFDAKDPSALRVLGSVGVDAPRTTVAASGGVLCFGGGFCFGVLPAQCGTQPKGAGSGEGGRPGPGGGGDRDRDVDVPPGPTLACFPTPMRGIATIRLEMPAPAFVRAGVFDSSGRRVRALLDGNVAAGARELTWDGRDDRGRTVAPGVYFARFITEAMGAEEQAQTLRIVRLP